MPIAYRSILRIPRYEDYYDEVEQRIVGWFRGRRIPLHVADAQGIDHAESAELSKVSWDEGILRAHRWTLREEWSLPRRALRQESQGRTGVTTVSLVDQGDSVWFWVDVDAPTYVEVDPTGTEVERTQWSATPRIIRSIIDDLEPCDGETVVRQRPRLIDDPSDLSYLLSVLRDPSRIGAAFVTSPNGESDLHRCLELMSRVGRDVAGMAQVFVLAPHLLVQFNQAVSHPFAVAPGSIRTFLPGADFASPVDAFRHRLLGRQRVDALHPNQVSGLLRHGLVRRGRQLRVPEQLLAADYGLLRAQRLLPLSELQNRQANARGGRPVGTDTDDLAEALASVSDLQQQVQTAQRLAEMYFEESANLERQLVEVRESNLLLDLELEEATETAGRLQARLHRLQIDMVKDGRGDIAFAEPQEDADADYPNSFSELYELVDDLEGLRRCDVERVRRFAKKLDEHPSVGTALKRAWEGLLTLSDYARIRGRNEFAGGLRAYLNSPDHVGRRLLYGFRGNESETVQNSERLASQRAVSVPLSVDESGQIAMVAHMALATGRAGSPRLYFHDNVANDGLVYIGYLGEHLRNTRTN